MPDDLSKRHPEDGKRVSKQPYEIATMLEKYRIPEEAVEEAKAAVGDSRERIEQWLKEKHYLPSRKGEEGNNRQR